MGRDWIRQLNILPISNCDANVNNIQIDATVNELLNKYDSLFGSSVKPVKNYNYNISLKNDARPVFKRARPVPFTLLPSVEKELQRLEDEGVISKTTFSEWATPVVPVRKPNGDIRLCADYSSTVNPQITLPQHPFPGYEEVFVKLNEGKLFSTLRFYISL